MGHNLREYLGDKSFYLTILRIAIPVSLQQLITVGINLMDTIMLSSMGDAQLSASSQASQFINLFQIFCMGIGMGASVLTARFWGMQDKDSLRKAVTIMLRIVLAFASVFFLATLFSRLHHEGLYHEPGYCGLRYFLFALDSSHLLLYGTFLDLHHYIAECRGG